jgi:quercetin dioxygenase-like cupin family protein
MKNLTVQLALLAAAMFIFVSARAEQESVFRYTTLLTDAQGKTYFVSSESELKAQSETIKQTDPFQAGNASFMWLPKDATYPWHTTPVRQYLLILQGAMSVEAGTGETQTFSAGDVLLVADTAGQGHRTRVGEEGVLFALVEIQ